MQCSENLESKQRWLKWVNSVSSLGHLGKASFAEIMQKNGPKQFILVTCVEEAKLGVTGHAIKETVDVKGNTHMSVTTQFVP